MMNASDKYGTLDFTLLRNSSSASPSYMNGGALKGESPGADVALCEIEIPVPEVTSEEKEQASQAPVKRDATAEKNRKKNDNPKPDEKYVPKLPLISEVEIRAWGTSYSYYDSFLSAAEKLKEYESDESEYIPFFSYMPQYSQMNTHQLGYYLWLRSEIRKGRFPKADYGYLMLMIYESVNLAGKWNGSDEGILPSRALNMLVNIWTGYRDDNPRLDEQLSEWVCDFCLIHRLPPPLEKLAPFLRKALVSSTLKEFFIEPDIGGDSYVGFLLRFVSGYDYTGSRFYSVDNAAVFDRHEAGALACILGSVGKDVLGRMEEKAVNRDSYVGAICHPSVKRRLRVTYRSFSASFETRFLLTNSVKYSENKIRALLGFKSRLSVTGLPDDIKKIIDGYFSSVTAECRPAREKTSDGPEWEKLYEVEKREASFEAASKIESSSWETTDILISAFGGNGDDADSAVKSICPPDNKNIAAELPKTPEDLSPATFEGYAESDSDAESDGTGGVFADFISFCLKGDREGMRECARLSGMPVDMLAGKINDAALDSIGDIIIENTDGLWTVIPDYTGEAEDIAAGKNRL
ncbi:MAG: TerB N-terminal domain-containing protein [Clostridia bacterium]|nr:TerB N-terminal domain-containing protein [Clostridia bacterium]